MAANHNGHSNGNGNGKGQRPFSPTLRDVTATAFRHRRLMVLTFLGIFIGALAFAFVWPKHYEAHMKILVQRDRVNPPVTPVANTYSPVMQASVTEEDINSEVQLILSQDLLEKVVEECGLEKPPSFMARILTSNSGDHGYRVAMAVERLRDNLKVSPMPKTNLIAIRYKSSKPELATKVLQALSSGYLEKHVAVHQPHGAFNFFEKEASRFRQQLDQSELQLADFSKQKDAVSPTTMVGLTLQKVSDFQANLEQTRAQEAATRERIGALQKELGSTPSRLTTTDRTADNGQLLQQMKSTLLTLEIQRQKLIANYSENYRPVQDVEAQIALTKSAIQAAEKSPVREQDTDQNPTYQWVTQELAKSKTDLASEEAQERAESQIVQNYQNQAISLNQKGLLEGDLLRTTKAQEVNYLLYQNKGEEARIAEALDEKRIVNVAIAEAATLPELPVHSPWLYVGLGLLLAVMVSMGLAFTLDYLDPSFRTPNEVEDYLDIPVFAAIPRDGHTVRMHVQ
ncbi:MAG TPA: Wzz/FepE/Etk N-terminal domain-containing protein [Terriglobia bacterium]|nr:Wzz/FepE/Etk N-terminal domain-containing protein [Terriglobia bacterium]